ncbi:MAG: substrate-binding domain-containing protein [Kiritimatiellae bacterium]|nr:substrate-binding domain-containing protein [Kiritimatiellia bacterium]
MLTSADRPTAFVSEIGEDAMNLIRLALSLGLRVPEDVAVMGFGDYLENVEMLRVPLSSAHLDLERMGSLAMQVLLREMEKPSKRHAIAHIPMEMMIRESCGGKQRNGRAAELGSFNRLLVENVEC